MDYTKQTVLQLRALLKERNISSTGLTRKAQIVEKLEEADRAGGAETLDKAKEEGTSPAASSVTMGAEEARRKSGSGDGVGEAAAKGGEKGEGVMEGGEAVQVEGEGEGEGEKGEKGVEEVVPVTDDAPPETEPIVVAKEDTPPAKDPTPTPKEPTPPPKEPTPPPKEPTPPAKEASPATPPPAENEAKTVEKEVPLPAAVEAPSVEPSVEPSRLNSEEMEADSKKRKRRSNSPDVKADDIRSKKLRTSGEGLEPSVEEVVHIEQNAMMEEEQDKLDGDVVMEDKATEPETEAPPVSAKEQAEAPEASKPAPAGTSARERDSEKDNSSRFKSLFEQPTPTTATPPVADSDTDRSVSPSLHPATAAIYIRNFMRPLQLPALRNHLIALASPPSSDPDPTVLKTFFLDQIRTHAFVVFGSISAAARVRTALHGAVWPTERDRKSLWVDFVPEDHVEGWIKTEEEAASDSRSGRGPARRYKVAYIPSSDGDVPARAVFQEEGANGGRGSIDISAHRGGPDVGGLGMPNAPTGPRGPAERRASALTTANSIPLTADRTQAKAGDAEAPAPDPTKSFQTLDKLFSSTTAKPKLYFQPVEPERAEARLDALKAATSRNWDPDSNIRGRGRGRLDEKVRYGFEKDVLMEFGPDFGPGAVQGWGGRGGGYRGRGGFRGDFRGDSYRGGGMAGRLDREGDRNFGDRWRGGRGGRGGW
ncbi:uncharacterized protein BDZ99DRAFT_479446 [Mytilinidion resinicola]|uniref:SAP domain-containing protein n=1 Tax=Mytilinidion resinicola TaxID=574789 RepID=A0A6A6YC32_9PEZI|nr:uncharacterized protein BDZ99DRAFT_479446 [Mytilinidion resinicola]KAF2806169.1 hypothetical protein BDZ99DRAFT_479446 [Mytilinidion resinicola]